MPAGGWSTDIKNKSPEEMKKGMEEWVKWKDSCGTGLVDMGAPLGKGQTISLSGAIDSNDLIAGYSILQAQDIEEAKKMLENHPHLKWADSCTITVYPTMPMH